MYSHYMYYGLVTTFITYIVFLWYIYMRWCIFSSLLSHMCCFFSIFIHMFLLVYNLSMFHTKCLDEPCLNVLIKTSCKSTMPWSLFLQNFSRVHVRVRLMYFCKLWDSFVKLLSELFFVVLSWIAKEGDY